MLKTKIAFQNIAERTKNKTSPLDFSFLALFFFCNIDLKSNNCRKKHGIQYFSIRKIMKNNSDLISKEQN